MRKLWRWINRNRTLVIGLALLSVVVITSVFAPWFAHHDPRRVNPINRLLPVGHKEFRLGTDSLGRDQLSRLLYGGRVSLGVGAAVAAFTLVTGIALGTLISFSVRLDGVLMRVLDGMMAFPSTVLAIALVGALGPRLSNIVIALTIVYTPRMARVVRSAVLTVMQMDYVQAARALGAGRFRIIGAHILRNAWGPIIVQTTVIFSASILAEASLSFLGVSGEADLPTWGGMLSEARLYMRQIPTLIAAPGVWLMTAVLALNLLGDGLRDLTDPYVSKR